MNRFVIFGRMVAIVLATAATGSGCTYSPHPGDGELPCSTGGSECPEDYECMVATNTCWSKTAVPDTHVTSYLGIWAFASSATIDSVCDNGNFSAPLGILSMGITPGPAGMADLTAQYPCATCSLLLKLDTKGAHLSDPNPVFETTAGDPTSVLTVKTFTILTTNGKTATHSSTYDLNSKYASGSMVHCTQTVTTTLTKS